MKIHPCASFLLIKDGQVLLEKRSEHKACDPNLVATPGGHLEAGESPEQALLREVKEELGVQAQQYVHVCSLYHPSSELQLIHYFAVLAWSGDRRGVDGARTAVVASALAGFASFFSFLGFGYFDTLHAFVAAVLFQLTVQVMVGASRVRSPGARAGPDDEDRAWRRAQWGQLCWVVHAVGLLIAGSVILGIGMTRVFVSEDLDFLCMTADQVRAMGDRVVSVVAHDRATLGGMLWAAGVAMLLPVLWCHERGARWLWQAMAGLGLPAYASTLGLHAWVGYTDWRHILPAVVGLALWAGGLALSAGYLRSPGSGRPD